MASMPRSDADATALEEFAHDERDDEPRAEVEQEDAEQLVSGPDGTVELSPRHRVSTLLAAVAGTVLLVVWWAFLGYMAYHAMSLLPV